jgi:hypothetical protein
VRWLFLLLCAGGCASVPPLSGCISTTVTGSGKHRTTHYWKNNWELDRDQLADALADDPPAADDLRAAHRRDHAAIGLFAFGYALVPSVMVSGLAMAGAGVGEKPINGLIGAGIGLVFLDMAAIAAVANDAQRLRRRGLERYNEWAEQNGCR